MTSIDTAEDTPGLPNFLNRNHPNCKWRSDVKPGPKETALRANRETGPKIIIDARTGKPVTPETVGLTKADVMSSAKANGVTLTTMAKAIDDSKRVDNQPAPPAKTKETTTMKTTTKTKAAAKAAPAPKKPAPARAPKPKAAKKAARENARTPVSARPDGLREGSKQAVMLDMALRQEGATEHAICGKLGWKKCRVTLRRVCEKVGAKLETRKNAKQETVFFATLKAKA